MTMTTLQKDCLPGTKYLHVTGRSLTGLAGAFVLVMAVQVSGCQSSDVGSGSTEPLNDAEQIEYNRALNRCLKSGGSRIVKILNQLRCY